MRIVTIYTLYGRRAGAELCFEKTIEAMSQQYSEIKWIVLCNKSAQNVIEEKWYFAEILYVPWLDNQYKKAFWLEFLAGNYVDRLKANCFWIPSGCNHFPGKWHIPTLSTFHDLGEYHITNKYSKSRMIFRKRICIPQNIKRSVKFTSVSEFTKNDMVHFLGLEPTQIQVIYNGSSPHNIKMPNNSQEIINKYGLKKRTYFFTPGRTDYVGKGLDILLQAYRSFCNNHPDISLVLVGPEGEGHHLLLQDLEKGKYKDNILYLGRVDDETLISLYTHSLATVISSRFEGFGFPILEAMRFNTPIICSNAGSLEEIAGDAAVIFKSGDSSSLYEKMNFIYDLSLEEVEILTKKGRKRLGCFSWNKCAELMFCEFSSLC